MILFSDIENLPCNIRWLVYTYLPPHPFIEELKSFIDYEKSYIYKKKTALNDDTNYLMIRSICHDKYVFRSVEKFYTGDRVIHFLHFYQAILHLKHHPTGCYHHGDEISWIFYDYDSYDDSGSD